MVTITRRRAAMLASATAGFGLVGGKTQAVQDTIKIGLTAALTGPGAEYGLGQVNGATLALEAANAQGGALGRQIELVIEDSQSTNPGAVLAFSRLARRSDISAFIGAPFSTQMQAMAPDILKVAKLVVFGATDPTLTRMGNPWLFRCRPNDLYSARVMADFGVNTLGKRRWVIVHSIEAFGSAGMRALVATLEKLNVKPVLVQGFTSLQPDLTPVALAVKQSEADLLASYLPTAIDVALLARQLRQVGVATPWIGSATIAGTTTLNLAGSLLFDTYGVVDFDAASSPEAAAFAARYEQRYKARADFVCASSQ